MKKININITKRERTYINPENGEEIPAEQFHRRYKRSGPQPKIQSEGQVNDEEGTDTEEEGVEGLERKDS